MPERSVKGFEPGSATLNANTQPLTPILPTTKHGKRLERFESTEAHQGRHRQEVELEASEEGERVQDRFQGDPGSAPEPDVADFRRNSLNLKKNGWSRILLRHSFRSRLLSRVTVLPLASLDRSEHLHSN